MKNKRALVMMAVAILFGLAAVALASRWLLRQPAANANRIAVAATDITLGQKLTPAMFKLVEWPAASVPKDSFLDPTKLEGRVVKTNLSVDEAVTESKLAAPGTSGGLSSLIREGNRAITVRVNDVIGVAGFALPGNYVDIIVSTQKDAPNGERVELNVSKIVLERILVLAVAQELGRDETKPKVVNAVTLEVTPEQAERLDLARSVGTLSLALRNQVDQKPGNSEGATKRTLLQEVTPAPKLALVTPAKPAPRPAARPVVLVKRNCVSVLNGVNVSQECF
jgi:pilus assembly protein CpaB